MRIEVELPDGLHPLEIASLSGDCLTKSLRQKGIPLNTRCGERGLCRACRVDILQCGEWVSAQGCRLQAYDGMRIRVEQSSLLTHVPQVINDFHLGVPFSQNPLFPIHGLTAAVDVGTTTVAIRLIDPDTAEVVFSAGGFNNQMRLGDDVLTRINQCMQDPEQTAALQRLVNDETIIPMVVDYQDQIAGWVISGNTTMLHLVAGVDPTPMGTVPFAPAFLRSCRLHAKNLNLGKRGEVVLLPGVSAYVGADIIAGMVASGFAYDPGPNLYVDVGTNGEMVVHRDGKFIACATAAGPAFEGSGLSNGVRAGDGAIAHITLSDDFTAKFETIGLLHDQRPIGLCGTAYVDFLAQGRAAGLLSPSGRFTSAGDTGLVPGTYGQEFLVALGQGKRPLTISEPDIASLLQAKAAIAAGVQTLLKRVHLKPEQVQTVYLAGGFGLHLDLVNTMACGLLPGFAPDQVRLVGNASLGGAFLASVDGSVLSDMSDLINRVEVIELNQDPEFEDAYIDCLALP